MAQPSKDERVRIQLSLTPESVEIFDEMCQANGVSRSSMCEIAIRKYYFNDEVTAQMRDRRKLPRGGR